jgi:hypothetical protein
MSILIPVKHLERKRLSEFASYSEDTETAKAFEAPYRHRLIAIVIGAFAGWPVIGVIAFFKSTNFANHFVLPLIIIPFGLSFIYALYHVANLARKKPRSMKSGKEMVVYLREDNPPGIYRQFIYVCDESRTYFVRTFSAAGPQ